MIVIELKLVPAGKLLLFVIDASGTPLGNTRSSPPTGTTSQLPAVIQFVSAPSPDHVDVDADSADGAARMPKTRTTKNPVLAGLLMRNLPFTKPESSSDSALPC